MTEAKQGIVVFKDPFDNAIRTVKGAITEDELFFRVVTNIDKNVHIIKKESVLKIKIKKGGEK